MENNETVLKELSKHLKAIEQLLKQNDVTEPTDKKLTFEQLVNKQTNLLLEDAHQFDLKKIFSIMSELEWKYCAKDGSYLEPVAPDSIKENIQYLVAQAIEGVIKNYNNFKEPSYCIETGGFRIHAFKDDEDDTLEIKLEFIPQFNETSTSFSVLLNAYNKQQEIKNYD